MFFPPSDFERRIARAIMSVHVQPVTTRRQKKLFLEFPWELYRNDPLWVPPLRSEQKQLVGYWPHPFYDRNSIQTFLAYRNGTACGRIAAICNQTYIDTHDERRGFFGFFECVDDVEVAHGLFDAARHWLADRDITCLRGPASPGLNYSLGTLIEGFDSSPTFLMPYGPRYYPKLIESYGFRKSQDLYAYYGDIDMLPRAAAKLDPIADQIIERYDIRIRQLDKKKLYDEVAEFIAIYNASLVGTWGYEPMPPSEVRHMASGLKHMLVPEVTAAAEIDGRLVGAGFALPDYNPRIKAIDGRLFPFGFMRLLANKKAIKKYRLLAANVVPEYQMHGVGPRAPPRDGASGNGVGTAGSGDFVGSPSRISGREAAWKKPVARRIKTYRVYDFDP